MILLVSGSTKSVARSANRPGIGRFVTPANGNSVESIVESGLPWAVDNGAFSGFDAVSFRKLLGRVAKRPRCLFVACPDKVGNAKETLREWYAWRSEIENPIVQQKAAYVLQDGQEDSEPPKADAYFIGGSTHWKLSSHARFLAEWCKRRGAWLHMGRVNSRRRMRIAYSWGCDSIDGTSTSMFGDTYIRKYLGWIAEMKAPRPLLASQPMKGR